MKSIFSVRRFLLLLLVSGAVSLIGTAGEEARPESLSAKQILERMANVYAGCKTYRDAGVVKEVYFQAEGNRTEEKSFSTAFVRPDRFRFEYKSTVGVGPKENYIIWRQGKDVKSWWDIDPGVKKEKSLDYALAGATGVSSVSAHTIPALLMPNEISGFRLTEISDARRIDDAKIDNVDCFRIEGKHGKKADGPTILWIDRSTFLARRIDEKRKFGTFRVESTTTYDPVLNGEITDQMLEFNPPRLK